MGKFLVVALVALAPMASGAIGHAGASKAPATAGFPMPGHSAAQSRRPATPQAPLPTGREGDFGALGDSFTASQSTRTALATANPEIDILNFQFAAPTLTVPVGTTVTWVNHDEEPHTVTSATRLFASPGLDTGESFSFRFAAPGTYTYFCALHPHMTAKVIVQ